MSGAVRWPVPAHVGGLVDFAYALTVGPSMPSVLPDARAGLVWLSDGTLRICGPETRPWRPTRPGMEVVGLRLSLGAAPTVLGGSAAEILDRRIALSDHWGCDVEARLATRIATAQSTDDRVRQLMDAVASRAGSRAAPDDLDAAIASELRRPGVRVDRLAARVGLSERQLRRRCRYAFGYPPSTLARLLRLQRFLRLARGASKGRLSLAALAHEVGYADQAHLSRDCRVFTGFAPSYFLASTGPPGQPGRSVQDVGGIRL